MLKSVFCSSDILGVLEAKGKMSKNIWGHIPSLTAHYSLLGILDTQP